MEITQVKIFPVEEEKLKAFVSIVFDHCFMVNDIKVIEGKDGLFLSMPSRRKRSGEFKDVAHPLNNETRRRIEVEVLEEYRQIVDDTTPRRPDRVAEPTSDEAPASAESVSKPSAEDAESPAEAEEAESPAEAEEAAAAEEDANESDESGDDALGEVQERHLRDSFWQVT